MKLVLFEHLTLISIFFLAFAVKNAFSFNIFCHQKLFIIQSTAFTETLFVYVYLVKSLSFLAVISFRVTEKCFFCCIAMHICLTKLAVVLFSQRPCILVSNFTLKVILSQILWIQFSCYHKVTQLLFSCSKSTILTS